MLVLNNDFASQLQEKVAKNYIERTYDNLYRKQASIEEKVSKATSKIDTGLKKSGSSQQLTSRPKTALTMRGFKRKSRPEDRQDQRSRSPFDSRKSLTVQKYDQDSIERKTPQNSECLHVVAERKNI